MVLALAGCGAEAESSSDAVWSSPETAPAVTDSRAASPSSARGAEPSASSSPTVEKTRQAEATRKPTTPQKTKAPSGGGTKYPGCADGDCKVSFSGSVEFSLRGWTVSAFLENGGVKARLTKPNGLGGGGGFMAGPGCALEIHADGGGRLGCDKPPAKPDPGGYFVQLLELDGRTAVIRAVVG